MLGFKLERFGAKRRLLNHCSPEKYQRFPMQSLRGSTRDSTVPTTTMVTGGFIGPLESFLLKSSTLTLSNAKTRANGSHKTLLINYG